MKETEIRSFCPLSRKNLPVFLILGTFSMPMPALSQPSTPRAFHAQLSLVHENQCKYPRLTALKRIALDRANQYCRNHYSTVAPFAHQIGSEILAESCRPLLNRSVDQPLGREKQLASSVTETRKLATRKVSIVFRCTAIGVSSQRLTPSATPENPCYPDRVCGTAWGNIPYCAPRCEF